MAWNWKEFIADLKQTSCFSLSMTAGRMLRGLSLYHFFCLKRDQVYEFSLKNEAITADPLEPENEMQWYYARQTTTTLWDITWQFNSNIGICLPPLSTGCAIICIYESFQNSEIHINTCSYYVLFPLKLSRCLAFSQIVANGLSRPANSGGSWEPSSKKVFELQENVEENFRTFCEK